MKQEFFAGIKQVRATKTASSDIEIRLMVATDDVKVLDLGKLPAHTLVKVTVAGDQQPQADSFGFADRIEDNW